MIQLSRISQLFLNGVLLEFCRKFCQKLLEKSSGQNKEKANLGGVPSAL